MTIPAGQIGIVLMEQTMQWGRHQQLDLHIAVTDYTPVSHCGGAPEGSVAKVASACNLGMGVYTTES
jgi:hypothetical protein